VDEVKFSISEKGLELKAVDPANVAMVSLRIRAEAFDFFKADQGEIGVDLVRLSDVLSMADKGENVQLELDEESHKLKIGVGSLSYTLSLIDPSAIRKEPRIPELDLPAHVTLPGAELRRAVKAAEKVSDHVVLGVSDEGFYMEAKGDIDSLKLKIPSTELLGMETWRGQISLLVGLPGGHEQVHQQGSRGNFRDGHRLSPSGELQTRPVCGDQLPPSSAH